MHAAALEDAAATQQTVGPQTVPFTPISEHEMKSIMIGSDPEMHAIMFGEGSFDYSSPEYGSD